MIALHRAGKAGVLGLLALIGLSAAASADAPSGAVIAVIQLSRADGAAGSRFLVADAPVYSGDKIVTGPIGETQIKFRDNTKLVVGPNSSMTIDAFVFNGNNTARQVSIDAVRGAFRFITGVSRKDAYAIATPTATISVRGTEFDFNVDWATGQTELVMFGGMTLVCPKTHSDGSPNTDHQGCVAARAACGMTIVPPDGAPINQLKASYQRNAIITNDFRYIRNQSRLHPEFQVNTGSCGHTSVVPEINGPASGGNNAGGSGRPTEVSG